MNYDQFLLDVGELTAFGDDDADLLAMIPATIEYAEGRIYNDPFFDFLATRAASAALCTLNTRAVTKPAALISVDEVNVITPAGSLPDANGSTRNPLLPVSLSWLQAIWKGSSGVTGATGLPAQIAPLTDVTFQLGPVPDAAYYLEWIGPTRPTAFSAVNPSTFITANMPEVFLAASMVFLSGWMKNFGAQGDNPQQAQSWENQYQALKVGPQIVEARRKWEGQGWSSQPPAQVAKPDRS